MGGRSYCVVEGCISGSERDRKKRKIAGEKTLALFQVPRDEKLFEEWKKCVPVSKRELSVHDRVCELHFDEDDIDRYFINKLPNGIIHKLERATFRLRKGAVPVFGQSKKRKLDKYITDATQCDKYSTEVIQCDKYITEVTRCDKYITKVTQCDKYITEVTQCDKDITEAIQCKEIKALECSISEPLELCVEDGDIPFFQIKTEDIKLPSPWWGIISTPEFLMCTEVNDSYVMDKKVIIEDNLNVKVLFKDRLILQKELSSISEISRLLYEIHCYKICHGICRNSETCENYVKMKDGRSSLWCDNCRRKKIKLRKQIRRKTKVKNERQLESYISLKIEVPSEPEDS